MKLSSHKREALSLLYLQKKWVGGFLNKEFTYVGFSDRETG